jgi:hypothetical protein
MPDAQSALVAHCCRQPFFASHTYGEQSVVVPLPGESVATPTQKAPGSHWCVLGLQWAGSTQSASDEHVVLHAPSAQTLSPHEATGG